jgi:hypothetical protein
MIRQQFDCTQAVSRAESPASGLLMEAGIDGSVLAEATDQSERFNNQHENWLHSWPKIFSA